MINAGLFSSARGDWKTPVDLFADLEKEFGTLFDVSDRHGGTFDAFADLWKEPWYCNPPYGRQISAWCEMFPAMGRGVALLPARTDTGWFHEYILGEAKEIRFIRGRLHFDGHKNSAPFPSMLVIYNDS